MVRHELLISGLAEIVVWKRYSDFKKLHKDLWQIHKNLYRHTELFPPFAKAIVFGRFDETVIEERRQCAEDLLQFSANIPALYNSKQLEEFFKGGEVHDGSELIGPVEPLSDSLTDNLSDCSSEVRKDLSGLDDVTLTSQSECGGFSSDSDLISLTVDVDSLAELDDGMASNHSSPSRAVGLCLTSEPPVQSTVASEQEWSKPEGERESHGLFSGSLKPKPGKQDYLEKAGELIKLALKKEEEEDYEAAFSFYRKGVDLLLEGVQGESSPTRREAVKRKTAEYLMRAEKISSLYHKSSEDASVSMPPGSLSSRPSWNLRSPAEELKAFRVLGVIDKVLLVMDTRTQQTFILKGLRKSSEYSRSRTTIIPRCVPNMVCLHKYIISEESVFLVLQHAEEVGAILEETEACDWWSLGAILFELLTGKTLVECHPSGINTHTSLSIPDHVSKEARSLIQQLLQFNPAERLGAGVAGVEDIKSHPFFALIEWADLVK
ncbi:ribosomal protein S6 kinase delta-1 [Meleagris gallopavo]|uniref:ribosomal protein S6 kinase delta-1 n=1 Tax=Meleagris gallopavo TaxID=9103 RepID=UPI0012ABC570|nr:ribosomal protein S6 kinase delta-1 [Meleagris gallopavo]